MKFTGELKEKPEKAENIEDVKKTPAEVGMKLSDDELEQVAGGAYIWTIDENIGR